MSDDIFLIDAYNNTSNDVNNSTAEYTNTKNISNNTIAHSKTKTNSSLLDKYNNKNNDNDPFVNNYDNNTSKSDSVHDVFLVDELQQQQPVNDNTANKSKNVTKQQVIEVTEHTHQQHSTQQHDDVSDEIDTSTIRTKRRRVEAISNINNTTATNNNNNNNSTDDVYDNIEEDNCVQSNNTSIKPNINIMYKSALRQELHAITYYNNNNGIDNGYISDKHNTLTYRTRSKRVLRNIENGKLLFKAFHNTRCTICPQLAELYYNLSRLNYNDAKQSDILKPITNMWKINNEALKGIYII